MERVLRLALPDCRRRGQRAVHKKLRALEDVRRAAPQEIAAREIHGVTRGGAVPALEVLGLGMMKHGWCERAHIHTAVCITR
jgi:hypothetical protein